MLHQTMMFWVCITNPQPPITTAILKIAITTMMTDVSPGEIYHCSAHCSKIQLNSDGSHVLKRLILQILCFTSLSLAGNSCPIPTRVQYFHVSKLEPASVLRLAFQWDVLSMELSPPHPVSHVQSQALSASKATFLNCQKKKGKQPKPGCRSNGETGVCVLIG